MDENETQPKIAALKAIIQTMMEEAFWCENEGGAKAFFKVMLDDEDPVAVAIRNELTEDEIERAFSWTEMCSGSVEEEMRVMPIVGHLTTEQIERTRVRSVSMDKADNAFEFAMETRGGPGKVILGLKDRIRIGERVFILGMIENLIEQRDGASVWEEKPLSEETVEELPEPWKTHARRRLGELRSRLTERLENAEDE